MPNTGSNLLKAILEANKKSGLEQAKATAELLIAQANMDAAQRAAQEQQIVAQLQAQEAQQEEQERQQKLAEARASSQKGEGRKPIPPPEVTPVRTQNPSANLPPGNIANVAALSQGGAAMGGAAVQQALQQSLQGGVAAPGGQLQVPPTITDTTRETSVVPTEVTPGRFVPMERRAVRQTTRPNVLTAGDAAQLQQQSQQFAIEQFRLQSNAERTYQLEREKAFTSTIATLSGLGAPGIRAALEMRNTGVLSTETINGLSEQAQKLVDAQLRQMAEKSHTELMKQLELGLKIGVVPPAIQGNVPFLMGVSTTYHPLVMPPNQRADLVAKGTSGTFTAGGEQRKNTGIQIRQAAEVLLTEPRDPSFLAFKDIAILGDTYDYRRVDADQAFEAYAIARGYRKDVTPEQQREAQRIIRDEWGWVDDFNADAEPIPLGDRVGPHKGTADMYIKRLENLMKLAANNPGELDETPGLEGVSGLPGDLTPVEAPGAAAAGPSMFELGREVGASGFGVVPLGRAGEAVAKSAMETAGAVGHGAGELGAGIGAGVLGYQNQDELQRAVMENVRRYLEFLAREQPAGGPRLVP